MQSKEIMGGVAAKSLQQNWKQHPTSEPCRMDEMWVGYLGGVGENKSVDRIGYQGSTLVTSVVLR
jgi:hypothetical protein